MQTLTLSRFSKKSLRLFACLITWISLSLTSTSEGELPRPPRTRSEDGFNDPHGGRQSRIVNSTPTKPELCPWPLPIGALATFTSPSSPTETEERPIACFRLAHHETLLLETPGFAAGSFKIAPLGPAQRPEGAPTVHQKAAYLRTYSPGAYQISISDHYRPQNAVTLRLRRFRSPFLEWNGIELQRPGDDFGDHCLTASPPIRTRSKGSARSRGRRRVLLLVGERRENQDRIREQLHGADRSEGPGLPHRRRNP